jgi:transposase
VLPRRWVVEQTFGCMTRWRRLVRDYERRIDGLTAMILSPRAASSSAAVFTHEFPEGSLQLFVS